MLTAVIEKPGYKTATVQITKEISKSGAVGMVGNVLIGGIVGLAVDGTSGATQNFTPNPVCVILEPLGCRQETCVREVYGRELTSNF